jgi:hypothetical protein
VRGNALLDGLAEVLQQVIPVCDLECVRGSERGTLGIGAGAVTADHLNSRVGRQPRCQGCRFASRQDVDGPVAFAIRDHSGV